MNRIYSLLTLLLFSHVAFAQFQGDVFRRYSDAKVSGANGDLGLAWAGGANRPQIAMADFNNDGRQDIVLYEDRVGVKTLIATGVNTYKYDGSYETSFPENLNGYLKLIDFNRDDVPDLVHRNMAGVGIYYGYYDNNVLRFKYYKDLYYTNPTGQVNVYVAPNSLPAMADIDKDGDIDILAYDVWGTLITQYQNCQIEDGLPQDSIKICVVDNCFGKTFQNFERKQVLGSSCAQWGTTCKGCEKNGAKGTHGSNTLLLLDMDNDGDLDWFNGNESFADIQFFYNGKAQNGGLDSAIAQDTIWADMNGKQMSVPHYPGAYFLNVDHANGDDLLFTPMNDGVSNYNSIHLYENIGTNANKKFVFKNDAYLIDRMIDLGTGSYPVFFDYDKDGKKDLFIGSDGFYDHASGNNYSRIAHYKNTSGTAGNFSFELITDDFLAMGSQNLMGASLAMGDLDHDGKDDLVIGRTDGTFAFFKNNAASNTVQPNWVLTQPILKDKNGANIDVGDYAAPCIYDIDNDGKQDLISGNQLGGLMYFNNVGTTNSLALEYKTDTLGGVMLQNPFEAYAYSVPYIGPTDNTGTDYLVVGSQWGWLYRFDGFQNGAMPASYTMIDSSYSYINVGKRAAPAFANIDGDADNLYEVVCGNVLGGLYFYKQDFKVGIRDNIVNSFEVKVYPNPANDVLNINWDDNFANGEVAIQLMSVTGQEVVRIMQPEQTHSAQLNLGELTSGVYYCIIQSGGNKEVHPVTVVK